MDNINMFGQQLPQTAGYSRALGTLYRTLGDKHKAIEFFRNAVSMAVGKGKVTALCSLAELLSEMKQSDEAISLVKEALELEPNKPFVIATASMVYDATGQTGKALDIISDGLRISPDDTRLHQMAGMLLKKMGLFSDAIYHLERAVSDPSLGFSVTDLADVYTELGKVDEAEKILERYPGTKQRSPSYLSAKANILMRRGDCHGYEELMKKAIILEPDNVVLYGRMAQFRFEQAQQFVKRGDEHTALVILEDALKYISSGLQIEAENKLPLSLEHVIGKLRSRIGS